MLIVLLNMIIRYKALNNLKPEYKHLKTNIFLNFALPYKHYFTDYGWKILLLHFLVGTIALISALLLLFIYFIP